MYAPLRWLRLHRVPRGLAVAIVFLGLLVIIAGILALILPVLYHETAQLAKEIPGALTALENSLNSFMRQNFPESTVQFAFKDAFVQMLDSIRQNLPGTLQQSFVFVSRTISGSVTFILGLVLIPLMCYYFLVDADKFKHSFKLLFPQTYNERIETTISLMNVMLGNYVRGQLTLSFIMAVLVTVGLTLFGVKYALLLGLIAGIAELIPMVGPILGFIPAALLALAISPIKLLWVVILYGGLHVLENNVLVPRIMGRNMDLHPMTVIIAMMIGAQLLGVLGVLIALPVTAAGKIALNILVFKREEFGLATAEGCPGEADVEPD
jgi:predicted PurR-regulated permease PerM